MSSGSQRVVLVALAANLAITAAKFVTAGLARSSAMLAEAFHSVADCANQIFLLVGERRSRRPPDERHPFGHGQEAYFWAFLVALCIFAVGGGAAIDEGIRKILHRSDPWARGGDARWALGVLVGSIALEGYSFAVAAAEFRRMRAGRSLRATLADVRDPTVVVVLFEQVADLLGLLAALGGVALTRLTGDPIYDGIGSLLVGLALCATAWLLGRDVKSLLIGKGVPAVQQRRIVEIVQAHPDVQELVHQRTLHFGPDDALAAIKIRFAGELDTRRLERTINEIEAALRAELPQLRRIYIEPGFDEAAQRRAPGGSA